MSDNQLVRNEGIERQSLADLVSQRLLDKILSSNMQLGDPLPSSAQLAKQFDVSIVVIREAIAKLAGMDIVDRSQGRGTVLSLPSPVVLGRMLRAHAHFQNISVDELQVCRAELEVGVAWAAALSSASPEARSQSLHQSVEGMRAAPSREEFNEYDLMFHLQLAKLSGNRASQLLLESMSVIIRETLDVTSALYVERKGEDSLIQSAEAHAAIATCVVSGDSAGAAAAMAKHFTFIDEAQFPQQYIHKLI